MRVSYLRLILQIVLFDLFALVLHSKRGVQRGCRREGMRSMKEVGRQRSKEEDRYSERAFQSTMTMCCLNAFHFGSMVVFKAYAV